MVFLAQTRRQDLAAGGPKKGPHYKIQYWMYAATGVPGTTAFTNKYISMLMKGKNRFR